MGQAVEILTLFNASKSEFRVAREAHEVGEIKLRRGLSAGVGEHLVVAKEGRVDSGGGPFSRRRTETSPIKRLSRTTPWPEETASYAAAPRPRVRNAMRVRIIFTCSGIQPLRFQFAMR
jgi:hypothetical protein